jgi:hypothetical protein
VDITNNMYKLLFTDYYLLTTLKASTHMMEIFSSQGNIKLHVCFSFQKQTMAPSFPIIESKSEMMLNFVNEISYKNNLIRNTSGVFLEDFYFHFFLRNFHNHVSKSIMLKVIMLLVSVQSKVFAKT